MSAMDLKASSARITDLSTRFEILPLDTPAGPVLWADVEITYAFAGALAGVAPTIDIRVPIPFRQGESDAERKAQALRSARSLIDHACQAVGAGEEVSVETTIDTIVPPSLQGISEELGITAPRTRPVRTSRKKT